MFVDANEKNKIYSYAMTPDASGSGGDNVSHFAYNAEKGSQSNREKNIFFANTCSGALFNSYCAAKHFSKYIALCFFLFCVYYFYLFADAKPRIMVADAVPHHIYIYYSFSFYTSRRSNRFVAIQSTNKFAIQCVWAHIISFEYLFLFWLLRLPTPHTHKCRWCVCHSKQTRIYAGCKINKFVWVRFSSHEHMLCDEYAKSFSVTKSETYMKTSNRSKHVLSIADVH